MVTEEEKKKKKKEIVQPIPERPKPDIDPDKLILRDTETGRPRGIRLPDGRTILGIPESEVRFLAARAQGRGETPAGFNEASDLAAQRQEGVRQQIKEQAISPIADPLISNLEGLTSPEGQPSLQPEPITTEGVTGELARPSLDIATRIANRLTPLTGLEKEDPRQKAQQLLEEDPVLSRVLGGSMSVLAAAAVAGLGVIALPVIAKAALATKTGAAVTGVVGSNKALLGGAGAFAAVAAGGGLLDIGGGEIDSLSQQLSEFSGTASTVRGAVEAGMDPTTGLEQMQEMTDQVLETEARIKELGARSVKFRTQSEYLTLQAEILDTRNNLLEQTRIIRNLALTGETQVDVGETLLANLKLERDGEL